MAAMSRVLVAHLLPRLRLRLTATCASPPTERTSDAKTPDGAKLRHNCRTVPGLEPEVARSKLANRLLHFGNGSLKNTVRQAEIEILKYFISHQHARDTLEGIEKWWLSGAQYTTVDIVTALRRLANKGFIQVWRSVSSKPVYGTSADPQKLEQYLRNRELWSQSSAPDNR